MPHGVFVRHLRNALFHIGLDAADADYYAGHSVRSGAATDTADELPPHLISLAAGAKDTNWILTYHRASIGIAGAFPGPSASEALGRARARGP